LRHTREKSGLNQREVAERLGKTVLYVSRCERGERRMDVVELRAFCKAIGKSPVEFMRDLQKSLEKL
jgi:transcriptional regulator with XRE-family HTH domain